MWGGIVAGPLAAVAAVQVPESWSGPFLPVAILVVCIGGVAWWRRLTTPKCADRVGRGGHRQAP
jgi:hypothetical protein